jgi:hypothetical protein
VLNYVVMKMTRQRLSLKMAKVSKLLSILQLQFYRVDGVSRSDDGVKWQFFHAAFCQIKRFFYFRMSSLSVPIDLGCLLSPIFLSISLFILSGCTLNLEPRPSILVVAVDRLGRDAALCGDNAVAYSGFQMICQDSVRFTHAFTTSSLVQPAITSLMTAQLPMENGVIHNGSNYLSAQYQTVAEVAQNRGYRTAFFSGGAPIWSKTGLVQGFELFDDYLELRPANYYRAASSTLDLLWQWMEREVGPSAPFFATVYLADTQFVDVPTYDDYGAQRESSFEGQIKEIDESLASFFRRLKADGRWDSTYIVVTGLNGPETNRIRSEAKGSSLYSENVRIPLMIKPARKPRDESIRWTIDANVSLADVGYTLYSLLGAEPSRPVLRMAEIVNLKEVLVNPQVHWNRSRLIVTMSAWPLWHGFGGVRLGFRKNDLTLIYDDPPLVFNTLTDRGETTPLPDTDEAAKRLIEEAGTVAEAYQFQAWKPIDPITQEKNRIGLRLWKADGSTKELMPGLQLLYQLRPKDKQIAGWLAALAIREKEWGVLQRLGRETNNKEWIYTAQKNLGIRRRPRLNGCFSILVEGAGGLKDLSPRRCDDALFLDLLRWYFETRGPGKDMLREKFIRSYRQQKMAEQIGQLNYTNGLLWDVSLDLPTAPTLVQMALALPEMASYLRLVDQRTSDYN